jgi:hypothetical protein
MSTQLIVAVRRRAAAGLTALAVFAGLAVVAAAPAVAAPVQPVTFTAAGIYTVPVPAGAVAVTLVGLGAAGFRGDASAAGLSDGGAAGSGTQVAETLPVNSAFDVRPGDTLTVVVGAKGGGGQRGYNGGSIGGNGGNGGGATSIRAPAGLLLGAGGGGGGGGGGGSFAGQEGGAGGTDSPGTAGIQGGGPVAGMAGGFGSACGVGGTGQQSFGGAGETTGTLGNSGGGGGGGGEGFCGGGGGGSGDHGAGAATGGSGGGGGGAGASVYARDRVLNYQITAGTNVGDGSATITFDVAPPATLSSSSIAFSPLVVGTDSPQQLITITNGGDIPKVFDRIALNGADPADFFFSTGSCQFALLAGASCQLVAGFTPTAAGPRAATITFSADSGQDVQTIALTGMGQAAATATFDFTSIAFGNQPVGVRSAAQYVTMTNHGDVPLTFQSMVGAGDDQGEFSGDVGSCTTVLAAGSSCRLGASFDPAASGTRTAALKIVDSAADSPQTITLTGTGVTQRPATATLTANQLTFGNEAVGVISAPQLVTITNNGDLPLTFTGIAAAGANPADFSGVSHCPRTMPAGYSCQFGATFTPVAVGPRTAELQVIDSADPTPQTIVLTGSGIARPGAPTIESATPGDGTVSVTFAPPSDGGASIIDYTAVATDLTSPARGTQTATGSAGPITVRGLTNGDSYTVSVTARNAVGTGPASAASAAVTPASVPDAPATLTAVPGNAGVVLNWTAPPFDGGSPILGYQIYAGTRAGGESSTPLTAAPLPAAARSFAVKGLTNASTYYFTVRAVNAVGSSAATQEVSAGPVAALVISTAGMPGGRVGARYSVALAGAGGVQPYRWSLAGGSLPAGLTLSRTGRITGTPTRARTASFTLRVTDATGLLATRTLTLTVQPARRADLKITATRPDQFETGRRASIRFTVSNTGDAPTTSPTTVTVRLPAGVSDVHASGPGWAWTRSGTTVTFRHRGALVAGGHSSIVIDALVTAGGRRVLTTTAAVSPTGQTPGDNIATVRVTVCSPPRHAR